MFGIAPEEQVEWTKEPIAHKRISLYYGIS